VESGMGGGGWSVGLARRPNCCPTHKPTHGFAWAHIVPKCDRESHYGIDRRGRFGKWRTRGLGHPTAANSQTNARVCLGPYHTQVRSREPLRYGPTTSVWQMARAWVRAAESLIVRSRRELHVQDAWWLGAWHAQYEMSPVNRVNIKTRGHEP